MPEKPNQKYFEAMDIERFRDRARHLSYVAVPQRYPGWQLEGLTLSHHDFDRLKAGLDIRTMEHTKEWDVYGIRVTVSQNIKTGTVGLRIIKPEKHQLKMVTLGC